MLLQVASMFTPSKIRPACSYFQPVLYDACACLNSFKFYMQPRTIYLPSNVMPCHKRGSLECSVVDPEHAETGAEQRHSLDVLINHRSNIPSAPSPSSAWPLASGLASHAAGAHVHPRFEHACLLPPPHGLRASCQPAPTPRIDVPPKERPSPCWTTSIR